MEEDDEGEGDFEEDVIHVAVDCEACYGGVAFLMWDFRGTQGVLNVDLIPDGISMEKSSQLDVECRYLHMQNNHIMNIFCR